MVPDIKEKLINNYQKRKTWYGNNHFGVSTEFFEIEAGRAGIKAGDDILEIGFGEGLFLDWARESGFNISGVEINHDFYALAKKKDHMVYLGDIREVLRDSDKLYNGIFLFDVLEHLTLEEIAGMFDFIKTILGEKGMILARVPNGGSPFGRFLQNSDATHVTEITGSKLQDIAQLSGLEVKKTLNGARSKTTGAHKNRILKWFAYGIRDIIQMAIGYLYYGENIPMDPNLTLVIGHARNKKKLEQ